ncbi:MAG: ATP-binding protein [Cyanobium sp. CACIAM 14]|nr:MAG: ATP-binding protein [Cyanobium sp. CACIAM 14]
MAEPIQLARSATAAPALLPGFANRHGCITGATGTGKTISLQLLAEGFSRIGVPVFLADVKGDLSGLGAAGAMGEKLQARLAKLQLPWPAFDACPVTFWDVYGENGHPLRATISDMGPLVLGRLLELNDTQEGVLSVAFRVADDNVLLLLDLKDLRAILQFVGESAASLKLQYGNVSAASIGAIQRALLRLEEQGGEGFFGEPMLDVDDLLQTVNGRGVINILAADRLMQSPRLYAAVLLWLLAELYERLPEVGDLEQPKLVFFFDEAHLLFADAPAALLEKVELVVRLIRSKGVGVYFVSQNPIDIPERILGQLGHRLQHALRAFTPRDQKAVRATAETMRPNPALDIEAAIQELAVGEALISLLDSDGTPTVTERAWILTPGSRIGPLSAEERQAVMAASLVAGVYDTPLDRDSAFEKLAARSAAEPAATKARAKPAQEPEPEPAPPEPEPARSELEELLFGSVGPRGARHDGLVDVLAKNAARSMGSSLGRQVVRGVLGSLLSSGRR